MQSCPYCLKKVSEFAIQCPHCGKSLQNIDYSNPALIEEIQQKKEEEKKEKKKQVSKRFKKYRIFLCIFLVALVISTPIIYSKVQMHRVNKCLEEGNYEKINKILSRDKAEKLLLEQVNQYLDKGEYEEANTILDILP